MTTATATRPRKLTKKQQEAAVERRIKELFRKHSNGRQINVMDIGKIFTAGFNAYLNGEDVDAATIAKIDELCFAAK